MVGFVGLKAVVQWEFLEGSLKFFIWFEILEKSNLTYLTLNFNYIKFIMLNLNTKIIMVVLQYLEWLG